MGLFLSPVKNDLANNSQTKGTPSRFETKIEAEKAAKDFNCTGAHEMADKWMPCKSQSAQEDKEHNKSNISVGG